MDAKKKDQASSSSCLSVKSDSSKDEPPDFSNEERNLQCTKTDRMDANYKTRPTSPTPLSHLSDRSRTPPPYFVSEDKDDRNVTSVTAQFLAGGPQAKTGEHEPALPSLIENWNKEHVKDWLIFKLRISTKC
ncbi:uncharacterized protein LOC115590502 isoform X2 [Sparus aurata]|uniref:uncharacterized protein LOC115590502 isoform X2 n=1 Tax=Sparus aurata TaxID=8175 RepID=UPI0011C0F2F9|nr:uncharacterized protein LOC115590502 isoform X2 [Sparus aurata]